MFLQLNELNVAVQKIENNQIVGIPTETVYGIGVNPYSQNAVDNLFKIKEREDNKPISLLIHSFAELHKLNVKTEIPEVVELYWPGPLTIVVEINDPFPAGIGTSNPNSVGIRVPENSLAIELLKLTGPLAVTSANISGNDEANNHIEAEQIFGNSVSAYLEGDALHGDGSTVVDLRVDGGKILRQGPLRWPPSYC
jgi:tRNA threonylcarbamoyl adenosine modification protein (Sua5/YciO/YrdC/YwlC family)